MATKPEQTADEKLLEQVSRHSVLLERLKAGEVKKFETVLRQVDTQVRDQLTRKELTTYSRSRLEEFLARVGGKLLGIYQAFNDRMQADLADIALYEAAFEGRSLAKALLIDAVMPTDALIRAAINTQPLQVSGIDGGTLLKSFLSGWTRTESNRVTNAIRLGVVQGQTNADITQAIRGTAAQNFTDGVLAVSNRNARSVVQTAVQHVATTARMETLKANADVIPGYRWVSTLDRKTSALCKSLDGRVFELGKGPLPPAHVNCRSTTVPVTKLSGLFTDGATRASVGAAGGAQVSAGLSYYQWLQTQPAAFQDAALGPVRGKLFRDGGLTAERFAALQLDKNFKPLTLDQLKELEPSAFERAGL
ncbi:MULTISPECIES: phage head morphogenesis protein [unclassified Pseudomonas]|uniref:phage head morphogenesis protein n=1 Tax=unclassified Pseudomonas TaxID=196821 RepID=UPI0021BB6660|nr:MULTISPECIES: phage head morphogenesis protein [unclassified Pseudomonas]MCT8165644.1 phage head morphogenesis protein [Pseudomonas sp. HD6422]MCT8183606.1 phage head morphogenesis protein [Pseudomonas sp. HD6421]